VEFETLNIHDEGAVLFAEIAAPPMNLLGPELVRDLVSLIQHVEADEAMQVLVFKSADPDYFISHVDLNRIHQYRQEAARLTGEASIALMFRHLSASRVVTIAQIEGRVRAAGSEFVLACDMRFAARESAIFSQFEPAFGLLPGFDVVAHFQFGLQSASRNLAVGTARTARCANGRGVADVLQDMRRRTGTSRAAPGPGRSQAGKSDVRSPVRSPWGDWWRGVRHVTRS